MHENVHARRSAQTHIATEAAVATIAKHLDLEPLAAVLPVQAQDPMVKTLIERENLATFLGAIAKKLRAFRAERAEVDRLQQQLKQTEEMAERVADRFAEAKRERDELEARVAALEADNAALLEHAAIANAAAAKALEKAELEAAPPMPLEAPQTADEAAELAALAPDAPPDLEVNPPADVEKPQTEAEALAALAPDAPVKPARARR